MPNLRDASPNRTMNSSTASHDISDDEESWVTVRRFSSLAEANDHGLVALAMGEDCRVDLEESENAFVLQVETEPTPRLERELDEFSEEMAISRAQPRAHDGKLHPAGWVWYFAWMALLLVVYRWQGLPGVSYDRFLSSSHGLIDGQQWWRPFTSLFLHADLPHLAGNLLTGLGFTVFVARTFGAWKAWLLIFLCGTLGNAWNCWLQYPDEFDSLGASTTVFAALGLLSGSGFVENWRMRPHWTWPKVVAPVLAGVVLLGMLGTGKDPQTDVLGHVCGFITGLGAGAVVGHFQHRNHE